MSRRKDKDFWSHVGVDPTGCWLWSGSRTNDGYGYLFVAGKSTKAHRYAYELSHGVILPGMCVCHHCDTPPCMNPQHLFLGTMGDNNRDKIRKGRQHHWNGRRAGIGNPRAKLNPEAIVIIRQTYIDGRGRKTIPARRHTAKQLGLMFGVSPDAISGVIRGRTWQSF